MIRFKNGLLIGTTMSQAGDTLSLQAGGSVTNKGGALTMNAGGDVQQQGALQTDAPKVLTPEEKTAAEAALAGTTQQDTPPVVKTPQQLAADEAAQAAITPEQDLADAQKMIAENAVPENLKGLPAEDIAKFAPFTREFQASGDLTPESITKAAEAFGVKPQFVQQWVAGLKAQAAAAPSTEAPKPTAAEQAVIDSKVNAAYEAVGGQAQWTPFVEWAKAGGMTPAELQDLSTSVEISPQAAKRATAEYFAKFKSQGGTGGPRDLSRGAQGQQQQQDPNTLGFNTKAEQHAAMRDPRYNNDPSYRAGVEKRIVNTTFGGNAKGFV